MNQDLFVKKTRKPFVVLYKDSRHRYGWLYPAGNIMMSDGELVARLDHLITDRVLSIRFKAER